MGVGYNYKCTNISAIFSRYKEGPKIAGLEPILVVFQQQKEKDSVWARIKENPKKSKVVVTQFDSRKKRESKEVKTGSQPQGRTKQHQANKGWSLPSLAPTLT